jgi:hypothetical protein
MANAIYSDISSWVNPVLEACEFYLQQRTFMPQIVQVFNDRTGMMVRKGDKYSAGSASALTDNTDLSTAQTVTRTAFGTLTPGEVGDLFIVSDQRMESDNVDDIMSDLVEHIGNAMATHLDSVLLTKFTSFTGGSVGTAGGSLTWANIAGAQAYLRAAGVPGPYNLVVHEYAWYDLAIQADNTMPLIVEESLRNAGSFYVGSFGDMRIYTTGVMGTGTAVVNGIFNSKAIGYDIRRPLRIRLERNESLRATEIVWTHVYGAGVWRAEMGAKIVADASAP